MSRMRKSLDHTWRFAVCLVSTGAISVCAGVPVEGEASLLRILQDRQETNKTLFREGECDVDADERIQGVRAKAHVIWKGDRTFWDYVYESNADIQRPEGVKRVASATKSRMIEVPGRMMWYDAKNALAQVHASERPGSAYPTILELRPDQAWFRMDGAFGSRRGQSWGQLLDPNHGVEYISKFVVRAEPGERVVVERHYRAGLLRIEASLAHGGNVIEYSAGPSRRGAEPSSDAPLWRKGRYEWAQDVDGNWYPTHFEFQRSSTGREEVLSHDFSLEITSFKPHPRIPEERFRFSSLGVATGTVVEEFGERPRRYRIGRDGNEEKKLDQSVLEDLAERLREGFAAPDRDRK